MELAGELNSDSRAIKGRQAARIMPHLRGLWRAYCTLDSRRQYGMSVNPISIEAIGWYCFMFGYTRRIDIRNLVMSVSAIDAEWLTILNAESEKEARRRAPSQRAGGRRRR